MYVDANTISIKAWPGDRNMMRVNKSNTQSQRAVVTLWLSLLKGLDITISQYGNDKLPSLPLTSQFPTVGVDGYLIMCTKMG